jgi:hypothetical protein
LEQKSKELTEETKKLEAEIEEIKANKIFENAFEWRFEFPEVLNDDGDFVGFDVVIGNPPYINKTLNDIANFTYGVITGLDKAFLVPSDLAVELGLENEITKKFIRPQNYKKYNVFSQTYSLVYPYYSDNSIIPETELSSKFPNCFKFLSQYKTELENRKDSRTTIKEKGIEWYSIMRRVDIKEIDTQKIIFYDVGMLPNL